MKFRYENTDEKTVVEFEKSDSKLSKYLIAILVVALGLLGHYGLEKGWSKIREDFIISTQESIEIEPVQETPEEPKDSELWSGYLPEIITSIVMIIPPIILMTTLSMSTRMAQKTDETSEMIKKIDRLIEEQKVKIQEAQTKHLEDAKKESPEEYKR